MKRILVIVMSLILVLGSANISYQNVSAKAKPQSKSYYLSGYYETAKMYYKGGKVAIKGTWKKKNKKQLKNYEAGIKKNYNNKLISVDKKCKVEYGDEEMERWTYKNYAKEKKLNKGDSMTAISMLLQIKNGKIIKIGFYA